MLHRHDDELEDHDKGLAFDMPKLISRRRVLGVLGGTVAWAALAACGGSSSGRSKGAAATATGSTTTSTGDTTEIPDETAGPYPGDGSNGPNVLTESGVVRSDIRSSFGDFSGTADGIETVLTLTVLDLNNGAAPKSGAAVYLWHCTQDGNYSLYTEQDQNYLRGVQ